METSKIIAHVWERYQNMSEEEKQIWMEKIDERIRQGENEEEEEEEKPKE
jgi:hypothetical protein